MNRLSLEAVGHPGGGVGGDFVTQNPERRGECWFYTPRSAVKEGDLQPTVESGGGLADTEKDNNRQVLEMHFFPARRLRGEKTESWFSLVSAALATRYRPVARAVPRSLGQ